MLPSFQGFGADTTPYTSGNQNNQSPYGAVPQTNNAAPREAYYGTSGWGTSSLPHSTTNTTSSSNTQPYSNVGAQSGFGNSPYGYSNARVTQEGVTIQPWNTWLDHMHDILPWLSNQEYYATGLEGDRQAAISHLINSFTPGNIQAQIGQFGQQQNSMAQEQAHQMAPILEGQGMSSGASEGAQLNALNQAAANTNNFASQLQSPQGQQQILQSILSAIGQGQSLTALDPLSQMTQLYYGGYFPQNQVNYETKASQNALLGQFFGALGTVGAAALHK